MYPFLSTSLTCYFLLEYFVFQRVTRCLSPAKISFISRKLWSLGLIKPERAVVEKSLILNTAAPPVHLVTEQCALPNSKLSSPAEKLGQKLSVLFHTSFSPAMGEIEINAIKSSLRWRKVLLQFGAINTKVNFSS